MLPPSAAADGHYHLHVHTVSKLKGGSVLAMAAYRHAARFEGHDNTVTNSVTHAAAYQRAQQLGNNGRVFDYRRKIGVAWTGILAPDCTPKELLDAQTLWNTVERIEHRKNARLAREMIIALPHQVNLDVHIAMLRAFITTNLVSRGAIADVAIHKPPVEHGGDPRNWHAHVLLTDRPMTSTGFAAKKDPMWNAKESLLQWRKAWADTHNATMEHLGLPHRIDHRSLEVQRQDALQRGDVIAALDLDREPQIHVGKAHHARHLDRTIYTERRAKNEAILTRNKERAAARHDRMGQLIAKADTAAYHEARANAYARDTYELDAPSYQELQQAYGRPPSTSKLGRLKDGAFHGDVVRRALTISREHGHPWHANGNREGAPSIFDILRPMVAKTGPGHPVFTVTAKDIVFAFYRMGFSTTAQLQQSLENIAQEEQALFADRLARKPKLRPSSLPTPQKLLTPAAEKLKKYQAFAPIPQAIYHKRIDQLNAFTARHEAKANRRGKHQADHHTQRLARAMTGTAPFFNPPTTSGGGEN
jgi:MobA/MobL family